MQVVVPAGLSDVEVVQVLEPFAAAKYLHFHDITQVFSSFYNSFHKDELDKWMAKMVMPWCCKYTAPAERENSSSSSSSSSLGQQHHQGGEAAGSLAAASPAAISPAAAAAAETPTSAAGWSMVAVTAQLPRKAGSNANA